MPATYEPIATTTLGSAVSEITFSSIPQTYTDLVLELVGNVSASNYTKLTFNGVTTATYSMTNLYGSGSVAGSNRVITGLGLGYMQIHYLYTGSNQAPLRLNVMNYSNTTTFKSCLIREDDATYEVTAKAGLWQSTAAITSLALDRVSGNWNIGTIATLYGIKAA
jgi:hypothetical protein